MSTKYYRVIPSQFLSIVLRDGLQLSERTGDSVQPDKIVKRIGLLEEPDETGFYGDVILEVTLPPNITVKQSMYTEGVYVNKPIPPQYLKVYKTLS